MAEEVGVGYVRLIPSMRGFAKAAERQLRSGLAGPSRKAGEDAGDEIGDGVDDRLRTRAVGISKRFAGALGKGLRASLKPIAIGVGASFAATFAAQVGSALVSGVQAIGAGVGAGLALLPAAALAGVLALGTLKLALSGVGDALKAGLSGDTEKFNEALEGMAPAAQAVLRQVADLRGELNGLRATVQERLFGPLVDQVRPLAQTYLPAVESVMAGIATQMGAAARQVVEFLKMPDTARRLTGAMAAAGAAVENLVGSVGNLVIAFVPLVTVGASFLPGLTDGFAGATNRLAEFMAEAERSGQLREFIQGGIDAIRGLIDTGAQVGRIFSDIGAVIGTVFSGLSLPGGGLLDTIEGATSSLRDFVATSEGATVVQGILDGIRVTAIAVKGPLVGLAVGLGSALVPLLPKVAKFASALAKLAGAVLDVGIEILTPVVSGLAAALGLVLPPLTGLAELLARNKPVLQGIAIAIGTFLIPAFVAWAISAGAAAIATLAAAAPFILVGAAIAGFAALVIVHFDTIKNAIAAALGWVRDNWPTLLAILTGPIGLAVLFISQHWETIKSGATAVKDWVVDRFNDLVNFITGLPGTIASAAVGMFDGIANAAIGAFNTLINAWNKLDFEINVSVPSWVPGIGGRGFHVSDIIPDIPTIPTLHTGGIFEPGRDEGLARLRRGEGVFTEEQMANLTPVGSSAAAGATVVLNASGTDRYFLAWLRHLIATQGRGDVQVALGQ